MKTLEFLFWTGPIQLKFCKIAFYLLSLIMYYLFIMLVLLFCLLIQNCVLVPLTYDLL